MRLHMNANIQQSSEKVIFVGGVVWLVVNARSLWDPNYSTRWWLTMPWHGDLHDRRSQMRGRQCNIPCYEDELVSLSIARRRGVFEVDNGISRGILFEMGEKLWVFFVFARCRNRDLLVVCWCFVNDVIKVVGFFDLIEDFLALGRDSCKSFCHDGCLISVDNGSKWSGSGSEEWEWVRVRNERKRRDSSLLPQCLRGSYRLVMDCMTLMVQSSCITMLNFALIG